MQRVAGHHTGRGSLIGQRKNEFGAISNHVDCVIHSLLVLEAAAYPKSSRMSAFKSTLLAVLIYFFSNLAAPPRCRLDVLFSSLIILFIGASGLLWWKLARAQQENTQLRAEVLKLRGRLRILKS